MQTLLTYLIVALAVAYAVWKFVQRIRGKGDACSCGGSSGDGKCPECHTTCSGCPLSDGCKMKNEGESVAH